MIAKTPPRYAMTVYHDTGNVAHMVRILDDRGRTDSHKTQLRPEVKLWLKNMKIKYTYHARYISGVIEFENSDDMFMFKLSFDFSS